MKIYLARDGKQTGPFCLADVQRMVERDVWKMTDLAWCEGQPGWIQLKEIPGFFICPSPVRVLKSGPPLAQIRPGFVWVICVLIFVGTPISLWNDAHKLVTLIGGSDLPLSAKLYDDKFGYCIERIVLNVANLTGALFLFYLRWPALYLIGGLAIMGMTQLFYTVLFAGIDAELLHAFMPRLIFAMVYQVAVFGYVLHLYLKGVLR